MIQRSFDICLPYFEKTSLATQHVFGNPDESIEKQNRCLSKLLQLVRDQDVRGAISTACENNPITSTDKWKEIKNIFEAAIKAAKHPNHKNRLRLNLIEIVLFYT